MSPVAEPTVPERFFFDRFGLEHQIHANLERKVWLKSGGSLVIVGGGADWPYAVTQAQGTIDLRLTLGARPNAVTRGASVLFA